MKIRLVLAVVLTAIVTALAARHHYVGDVEETGVIERVVDSRVLGEERRLLVHLPESYDRETSRRYPVLYVLDGESHSTHTADSAHLLARIDVMPEVIVVGIPSSSETRDRDYTPPPTGQADRFLKFLETELIPFVDHGYRTTPDRMLAGNSRGGLLVVYSLIAAPDLFRARFAFSPALWRDDDRIVTQLAAALPSRPAQPTYLYLSLGDGENEKMTRAFRRTTAVLQGSGIRWRADITRNAKHGDNAVLSTPVALHAYFSDTAPRR